MSNITAYGSVTETGILNLTNRKRLQSELVRFKGKQIEVIIKARNRRSNPQNRYLWGVVYKEIEIRLRELGNDVDAETVHEFLKEKFNKKEIVGEGGEVLDYIGGSTTDMNRSEFSLYVGMIIEWAASFLSIAIPLPNTDLQLNFTESFNQ